MAELWRPQPIEVYVSWIEAIENEASDSLNDWESEFINDLGDRLRIGRYNLTRAQAEKLEKIYTEKTK